MKLGTIKRISRDDLAKSGEALPKWLDLFLDPLNQAIEKFGIALTGALTFEDNILSKRVKLTFTHAVEQAVNPFPIGTRKLSVVGVFPVGASDQSIDAFKWTSKQDGSIGVTFQFVGGSSSTQAVCTIIILLG
jgi:hypothetical protein